MTETGDDDDGDEVEPTAADKTRYNRMRQPPGDTVPIFPLDNDPTFMAEVAWASGKTNALDLPWCACRRVGDVGSVP